MLLIFKRLVYFIIILVLAACQTLKEKDVIGSESVHKSEVYTLSLLDEAVKKQGLKLSADDEFQAQKVLESNKTGQATTWEVGLQSLTMTPVRTYQEAKKHCREYSVAIKQVITKGSACRYSENNWKTGVEIEKVKPLGISKGESRLKVQENKPKPALILEGEKNTVSSEDSLLTKPKKIIISTPEKAVELGTPKWTIKVASFLKRSNAVRLAKLLKQQGYTVKAVRKMHNETFFYQVKVDVEGEQSKVEEQVALLKSQFKLSPSFYRRY